LLKSEKLPKSLTIQSTLLQKLYSLLRHNQIQELSEPENEFFWRAIYQAQSIRQVVAYSELVAGKQPISAQVKSHFLLLLPVFDQLLATSLNRKLICLSTCK
jgi:hypothetical protein